MQIIKYLFCSCLVIFSSFSNTIIAQLNGFVKISGIYPHLAVYNPHDKNYCGAGDGNECGIGAIVPWSNKLWMVTYSAFCPNGSSDKLWIIDNSLNIKAYENSIGGTPADRMIHRESNQLIIGPYFIDTLGNIRSVSYKTYPMRITAAARHLTDPQNKVYLQGMEGAVYETDVHSLKMKMLYEKPVPDWHGKGAYTGQNRYIISNNGGEQGGTLKLDERLLQVKENTKTSEDFGCLAEWDGDTWRIIERKQFTDVTGPGDIYGNNVSTDPVWSMGWDRRSVILKLLDNGKWYTYRLPKATDTYDFWQGHFTEWPRIRKIDSSKFLMDMFGLFYEFPETFSLKNSSKLIPLSSHLRITTDFCKWNDKIVISEDGTTLFDNPMAGKSWSNLWFGDWSNIKKWGPVRGYGSVWNNDLVKENVPSDPFLVNGFERKVLHLSHDNFAPVNFTIEIDKEGNNQWIKYKTIVIPSKSYKDIILPDDFDAQWARVVINAECHATATFHFAPKEYKPLDKDLFKGLADIQDKDFFKGKIRPAGYNLNLQVADNNKYYEVNENMEYLQPESRLDEINEVCEVKKDFTEDAASIIVEMNGERIRVPKGNPMFSQPFGNEWPRGIREITTERYIMNIHGTFYEVPQTKKPIRPSLNSIRPIASHNKMIMDFCSWRGLLVMSGVNKKAKEDGHVFKSKNNQMALWFGSVDDLWKLGKPIGEGGPWKESDVLKDTPSDKYLMTGYDNKSLELLTDKDVTVTAEINFDNNSWYVYKTFDLKANEKLTYDFPPGYNAHWIRFKTNKDCKATAWLIYK